MREREIAGLLHDKHPDGMQQLLLHYGPLIRYIIAPIVPDAHDREDCFSEVTLRIWEKADRFAPQRGSWKAWLTAVTRNTAYNFARQTARCGEGELPEHAPSPAGVTPGHRALRRVVCVRRCGSCAACRDCAGDGVQLARLCRRGARTRGVPLSLARAGRRAAEGRAPVR